MLLSQSVDPLFIEFLLNVEDQSKVVVVGRGGGGSQRVNKSWFSRISSATPWERRCFQSQLCATRKTEEGHLIEHPMVCASGAGMRAPWNGAVWVMLRRKMCGVLGERSSQKEQVQRSWGGEDGVASGSRDGADGRAGGEERFREQSRPHLPGPVDYGKESDLV